MIHFKNLNEIENDIANIFLTEAQQYFDTTSQGDLFQAFFELFAIVCNQRRHYDPNQLELNLNQVKIDNHGNTLL